MEEAVSTENVVAAQPTFSIEELEALFRTLDVAGDPRNEADRQLLMEALAAVEDATGNDVAAASHFRSTYATKPAPVSRLAGQGPFVPVTRPTPEGLDSTILEDEPSIGRDLRHAAAAYREHVSKREPAVSGGIIRGALPPLERADQVNVADSFICQASRALPFKRPSLVSRIVEIIKGESSESSWRAAKNSVNVDLQHGARRWHITLVFHSSHVFLTVTSADRHSFKRQVDSTQPEEFSKTLLTALDGDLQSTRLALDTVQMGLSSGTLEASH
ncbi:hypothetical protein K6W76_30350 [Burkholderia anthina]|uniref:hypothetical protein n=1 Tax=Burkholderia anthina TaxID=179879 RepID=UPI0015884CB4|nr:hypothetical protein [Burkholderia anthina]MBY4870749.1 hypothetical protein [Burkholderia anthina]